MSPYLFICSTAIALALMPTPHAEATHTSTHQTQSSMTEQAHAIQVDLLRVARQVRDLMHNARSANLAERAARLDRVLSQIHSMMRRHNQTMSRLGAEPSTRETSGLSRTVSALRINQERLDLLRREAEVAVGESLDEAWHRIRVARNLSNR